MEQKYLNSKENIKNIFSRIGIGLTAFIIVTLVSQLVIKFILKSLYPEALSIQYLMWINMAIMYLIGFPTFYLIVKDIPKHCYKEQKKIKFKTFLSFLAVSISSMYIFNIVGILVNYLLGYLIGNNIANPLESLITSVSTKFILVFVVILAPIVEETIFRQIILDRVRVYGDKFAIIFTALLFGLFHGNLSQFFYAFALGAIFAYLKLKTNKLIYPILLHIIINFMGSYVGIKILESIDIINDVIQFNSSYKFILLYSFFVFSMFISGIIIFLLNIKKLEFEPQKVQLSSNYINKSAYLNLGIIIFVITCLVQFIFTIINS